MHLSKSNVIYSVLFDFFCLEICKINELKWIKWIISMHTKCLNTYGCLMLLYVMEEGVGRISSNINWGSSSEL